MKKISHSILYGLISFVEVLIFIIMLVTFPLIWTYNQLGEFHTWLAKYKKGL